MNNKLEEIAELTTVSGMAKILGIKKDSAYKRLVRNNISTYRVGRVLLIPKAAIYQDAAEMRLRQRRIAEQNRKGSKHGR